MSKEENKVKMPQPWSYFNVLEMLVAAMPAGKYTADIGRWNRVVKNLEEEYQDKYPEIFRDIYFIEREPLNPYSSEIEEFFQRIALAVHNPSFDIMEITEEKRDQIKARATKRLDSNSVKFIEQIGRVAAESLKLAEGIA